MIPTCHYCGLRLHRTTSVDGIVGINWYDPDGRAQCLARVNEVEDTPALPHVDLLPGDR